jgi:hypothetical protein
MEYLVAKGSAVERAIERLTRKKYKELEEAALKKKIEVAIKATRAGSAGGIDSRDTSFIYPPKGFTLVYDSVSEGLEPVYFWVLDFMKNETWGLSMEVSKSIEQFEASVGGGFFGDMGTRAAVMQDRAMKMMTTINAVVRSIINIIYDLKDFEQRLDLYDSLHEGNNVDKRDARYGLKQIWMDKVDIQRGRGSINMLAQQLNFVTLRDAFMAADSEDDVWNMDLNERVKRILAPRLNDYLAWEKMSESELRRRYKIERTYLKSQVESLKLYSQWTKPYLRAAQQLQMAGNNPADLVNVFNNLVIEVSLFGKKEVKPEEVNKEWRNVKLNKKFYRCIEIEFRFRSIPYTTRQTQSGPQYTQGGRVEVHFRGFGLDDEEVKAVEDQELYEGFEMVTAMTDETLKEVQDDLDKYLKEEEDKGDIRRRATFLESLLGQVKDRRVKRKIEEHLKDLEKRGVRKSVNPFVALIDGFKEIGKSFLGVKINFKSKQGEVASFIRKFAASQAARNTYTVYYVYKKSHGMPTE